MILEQLEQGVAQVRTTSDQARDQRVTAVALKCAVFEGADKASGAGHQSDSSSHVPFVFRNQSERDVDESRGNQCKFVSDGSHGADLEIRALKLLPLSAFGFATAG